MRSRLREIAQESGADPKGVLFDSVSNSIPGYKVGPYRLLVATYIQPEKTKGGIFLADRTLAEDQWQGCVGLVLKLGPLCFSDDMVNKFGDFKVEVGDWVHYIASDGRGTFLKDNTGRSGIPCRILRDNHIMGVPDSPDLVY